MIFRPPYECCYSDYVIHDYCNKTADFFICEPGYEDEMAPICNSCFENGQRIYPSVYRKRVCMTFEDGVIRKILSQWSTKSVVSSCVAGIAETRVGESPSISSSIRQQIRNLNIRRFVKFVAKNWWVWWARIGESFCRWKKDLSVWRYPSKMACYGRTLFDELKRLHKSHQLRGVHWQSPCHILKLRPTKNFVYQTNLFLPYLPNNSERILWDCQFGRRKSSPCTIRLNDVLWTKVVQPKIYDSR